MCLFFVILFSFMINNTCTVHRIVCNKSITDYPLLVCLVIPDISPEVLDQIQDEGDTTSFSCQATGEPVPTISWYFNGSYSYQQ